MVRNRPARPIRLDRQVDSPRRSRRRTGTSRRPLALAPQRRPAEGPRQHHRRVPLHPPSRRRAHSRQPPHRQPRSLRRNRQRHRHRPTQSLGRLRLGRDRPPPQTGDNEILVKVVAQAKVSAPAVSTAFAASLRITAPDGTERRIPSDSTWQARPDSNAAWQPAQEIGPLTTPLSIGTDRHSEVPGPNRIATDAALLRKDFTIPTTIQSARLTITALGAYQAFLNGKPIAPQTLLNPGWTDFNKRVLYQTYDVTALLTTGDNTIAAILGGGWHGSPMTWAGTRAYPEPDALRAQLDITLTDGTHKTIATDETWQTAPAPTLFSEIYAGEVYDARLETPGWNAPHFAAKDWTPAVATEVSVRNKTHRPTQPLHRHLQHPPSHRNEPRQ